MIVCSLSAARLRPRAPEAQSGRRAGEAGLDLVQKLITLQVNHDDLNDDLDDDLDTTTWIGDVSVGVVGREAGVGAGGVVGGRAATGRGRDGVGGGR